MRRGRFEHMRAKIYFVDPLGEDHSKSVCKLEAFLLELCSSQRRI